MATMTALIVEHAQNDYIHPEGSLSKGDQRHIVEHIQALVKAPGFSLRILTESHLPEDSIFLSSNHDGREAGEEGDIPDPKTGEITKLELLPPNCSLRGSWGAQTIPEISASDFDFILEKFTHPDHITISSFQDIHGNRHADMADGALSHDLESELKDNGIQTVVLAGVHGEHCISRTALDTVGLGYRTLIVDDTVVFHDHGIDRKKHWDEIRSKGVEVVNLDDPVLQQIINPK